jgi:biotin carboxyl carrier protein
MEVLAPKSGFVLSISIADGANVAVGAALLVMDTFDEDRALSRLANIELIRASQVAQYTGAQLTTNKALAQKAVDLATEANDAALAVYQRLNQPVVLIGADGLEADRALADQKKAEMQKQSAIAQQQQLIFAATNHQATADLIKAQLDQQQGFLIAKKARATVIAPLGGLVKLKVGVGSFMKEGHVLLTVG